MGADRSDIGAAAETHGLSRAGAEALFRALVSGGGMQAQFNHPDLGGMGQWSNGMVQIGDMFNDALKAKVSGFCAAMAESARAARGASAGPAERSRETGMAEPTYGSWWPEDLGAPSASGSQNGLRYACFPQRRRLALERDGRVTLYDTGSYRLTGFAQQQGGGSTPLRFSGPDGEVALDVLTPVNS